MRQILVFFSGAFMAKIVIVFIKSIYKKYQIFPNAKSMESFTKYFSQTHKILKNFNRRKYLYFFLANPLNFENAKIFKTFCQKCTKF